MFEADNLSDGGPRSYVLNRGRPAKTASLTQVKSAGTAETMSTGGIHTHLWGKVVQGSTQGLAAAVRSMHGPSEIGDLQLALHQSK